MAWIDDGGVNGEDKSYVISGVGNEGGGRWRVRWKRLNVNKIKKNKSCLSNKVN